LEKGMILRYRIAVGNQILTNWIEDKDIDNVLASIKPQLLAQGVKEADIKLQTEVELEKEKNEWKDVDTE
jgi:hypothetical protein